MSPPSLAFETLVADRQRTRVRSRGELAYKKAFAALSVMDEGSHAMAQHIDSGEKVSLAWVLVSNELRHVSEFAHLIPRQRPTALCPVCLDSVTMRLGSERVHHASHQPASICSATQPETALHQNVKFYLAQQLKSVFRLDIDEACIGTGPNRSECTSRRVSEFAANWDDVQIEYSLNPLRPDIMLLVRGRPLVAIEVWVSHRVEEPKADLLKQMGVPWIELQGTESLYSGDAPWTPSQPLAVVRHSSPWRCDNCQAHLERIEQEYARQARWREEQAALTEQRSRMQPTHFRAVDIYYRSGESRRTIFRLVNRVGASGQVLARCLEENGAILREVQPPFDDASRQQLQAGFEDRLHWYRQQRFGVICDFVTAGWFDLTTTRATTGRNTRFWPQRYRYDSETRTWIIPTYLHDVQWFGDDEAEQREAQRQRIQTADADWLRATLERGVRRRLAAPAAPAGSSPRITPIEALLLEARACIDQGNWTTAKTLYERALAQIDLLLVDLPLHDEANRRVVATLQTECRSQLRLGLIRFGRKSE